MSLTLPGFDLLKTGSGGAETNGYFRRETDRQWSSLYIEFTRVLSVDETR